MQRAFSNFILRETTESKTLKMQFRSRFAADYIAQFKSWLQTDLIAFNECEIILRNINVDYCKENAQVQASKCLSRYNKIEKKTTIIKTNSNFWISN